MLQQSSVVSFELVSQGHHLFPKLLSTLDSFAVINMVNNSWLIITAAGSSTYSLFPLVGSITALSYFHGVTVGLLPDMGGGQCASGFWHRQRKGQLLVSWWAVCCLKCLQCKGTIWAVLETACKGLVLALNCS